MHSKKPFFFLCLLLLCASAPAQYKLQFIVDSLPAYHHANEPVFVAGSFNNWNPGDVNYRFTLADGRYTLHLSLPAGTYEYKFTRGGWDRSEATITGAATENRRLALASDTVIHATIAQWGDHFTKEPVQHTASKNVAVIDTAFYMPQLNRYRRIWVYLPASYHHSSKKYPVLYMHDGQNVFDAATSGFGEWGVDEALDTLGPKWGEMIVVAIDNGADKRLNEYAPYDMEKYGKGEGDAYVDFLVNTLRPYINKNYRTKKCRKHNFVAGSSMGGLISFYALLKYPKKFGGAGVFSPAFWINPQLKNISAEKAKKVKGKIYFYAGQLEGDTMVPDMLNVFDQMLQYAKAKMEVVIRAQGRHNEAAWRGAFPQFYKWLLQSR